MEKNSAEILREIEAALASLKEKVRALEGQIAEYKELARSEKEAAEVEAAATEVDFSDMEIGVADLPEEPAPAVEDLPEAEPVVEDLPAEPAPVVEQVREPAPVVEPAPQPEPVVEPEPVIEPAVQPEPEPAPAPAPAVDTQRMQWRLDKPGLPVKNIRSGISLYDRALFIGTLFKEDYALYDRTIGDLNAMASLDQAVDYLLAHFPDWNLKSDIVYNFMMAIRKKLG